MEWRWFSYGLYISSWFTGNYRTVISKNSTRSTSCYSQRYWISSGYYCICLWRNQCEVRARKARDFNQFWISFRNDKEYEDSYLKVELARRLLDEYPALKDNNVKRNEIRDHIISIVKRADQGKRKFLTFVDVNSTTASLNDFHKFILSALLQCMNEIFIF